MWCPRARRTSRVLQARRSMIILYLALGEILVGVRKTLLGLDGVLERGCGDICPSQAAKAAGVPATSASNRRFRLYRDYLARKCIGTMRTRRRGLSEQWASWVQ